MSEISLNLTKRELTGKKAKSLREKGIVPSVVFGGKEPILTQSEYVETDKAVRAVGYHSPLDLVIDGKKQMAMVKTVAMDPVKHTFINIEFQSLKANAVANPESDNQTSKVNTADVADIVLPKGVEFADKEIDTEAVIANVYDPATEAAERDAKAESDKAAEDARAAEAEAEAAEEEKKEEA